MSTTTLTLGIPGFSYADLYEPRALRRLYDLWHAELHADNASLAARYDAYRANSASLSPEDTSHLLVELAPSVSRVVVRLFGVEKEWGAQKKAVTDELIVFRFKDEFVKRRALKRKLSDSAGARARGDALLAELGVSGDNEHAVAVAICALLDDEARLKQRPVDDAELVAVRTRLDLLADWAMSRKAELEKRWLSFHFPHTLPDAMHLVHLRRPSETMPELIVGPEGKHRQRDGFKLTDRRMSPNQILDQVDYCLYCHDRDKDSCSKGLRDNKTGAIKPNALGIDLNGCPLDEKISEMHLVKRQGDSLGALALVCIDNPMCPGTGHRICNDCMKACVFQKQEPVNIPEIETSVLTDVLALPWGVEIYGLLTRWNPLNVRRPYALPYRGKDVLVVGLGPAGYTLAHHLINDGFGVIGVDGLKIEPLPTSLVGDFQHGVLPTPVHSWMEIYGELDDRLLLGFGGVSEYGITVRWDKNFLNLVYTTLSRRDKFRVYGGIRFGGTLTLDDIWDLGVAHVAIAVGAGKPTLIDIENNLIRGVRKASDFLMALQLTGAYKRTSTANLQVRLPALVIGGGLTGIDTATELLAYYVVQAEKALERHEALVSVIGEVAAWEVFDVEEREILEELLSHGRALRAERQAADAAHRAPNFQPMLDGWGGVSLVYRKHLTDSPAYRLNHEEVDKCLEEGVRIIENMSPTKAVPDSLGAVQAMVFERQKLDDKGKWRGTGEMVELPARTVCIAAGTSPNTIYEKEFPGTFVLDKRGFFSPHSGRLEPHANGTTVVLEADPNGVFTSYEKNGRVVSYYGDNHPKWAGSVVKAMASAKHGYPQVAALFPLDLDAVIDDATHAAREAAWKALTTKLDDELLATVAAVNRLTPTIVEVVVRAKRAARHFQPGQFYRLQNFESNSPMINGTRLTMEGMALTGAWTDPEAGLMGTIVLEMGTSTRLCAALDVGEKVVLMGPTGTPTEIPHNETALLCGGGLGNAVLFSIGRAMRAAGSKVLYFAGYRRATDVYKLDEIEAAADMVIWSVDSGTPILPRRPQDRHFVGNIVQAMHAYATGELGPVTIPLSEVHRVIAIGSDRMMKAVKDARHMILKDYFTPGHIAVGSINSPMQCMMKEVCAQCLQKHVDPRTGKETVVFSCSNQDQDLDTVDFANLAARLRANSVQEKLTNLWLDQILRVKELRKV